MSEFAKRMMAQKLMAESRDDPFSDSQFFNATPMLSPDDMMLSGPQGAASGTVTPGQVAYGTAAAGSLFAPGAGVADVMGFAPDPFNQGQMLPSFGENVRQGKYLDAGLQTLGVAGDVALAVAPLLPPAALLGAALKTPRVATVADAAVDAAEVDKTRRNLILGMAAAPVALKADEIAKLLKLDKAESTNLLRGTSALGKSLNQGLIPDNKILSALMEKIDNKLLDYADEGLEGSPDYEDLETVLGDLKEIQDKGQFPVQYEYIDTNAGDLYKNLIVEDFIESGPKAIKEDFDIDVADYSELKTDPNVGLIGQDAAQARYFNAENFEPPTAENPVSVVLPTETEPGIIAFHGSGADFDEFRLEMIGTGEGAQAYGYGLYFTDSEDIAKFYRDTISRQQSGIPQSVPENPDDIAGELALDINFNKGVSGDTKELQINSSDPDYDFYIQTLDDNAVKTTQAGAGKTFEFRDGSIISLLDETVPVFNGKALDSVWTSDIETTFGAEIKDIAQRAKDMGIPGTLEELTDDVTTVLSQLGQGLGSKRDMDMAVESLRPSGPGAPSRFKTIYNQFIEPKSTIETTSTVTELGSKKGKIYKVALSPKPDELLDYDLPLNQQSRQVQKLIENLVGDLLAGEPEAYNNFDFPALAAIQGDTKSNWMGQKIPPEGYSPNGDDLLRDLQKFLQDGPNQTRRAAMDASQLLYDFGIPGIKYRAAGSRGAATADEAAERNYVIFDEKAVKILEKYGIVGPVAVTAAGTAAVNRGRNDNDNDGSIFSDAGMM